MPRAGSEDCRKFEPADRRRRLQSVDVEKPQMSRVLTAAGSRAALVLCSIPAQVVFPAPLENTTTISGCIGRKAQQERLCGSGCRVGQELYASRSPATRQMDPSCYAPMEVGRDRG